MSNQRVIKKIAADLLLSPKIAQHVKKCFSYGHEGDEDGAYRWMVVYLPRFPNEDSMLDSILSCMPETYYGPGRFFSDAPVVRKSKTHLLITQLTGKDI